MSDEEIEKAAIAAYSHFMLVVREANVPPEYRNTPVFLPHWETEREDLRVMWRDAMRAAFAAVGLQSGSGS